VGTAIVRCDDLDVLALPAAIRLLVLDADVGEVDLVIEVRQVVFVRPFANLIGRAIRMAVVVVLLVALVEPALVLALQLVVEDDALDVRVALQKTFLGLFVRAIDLEVVFELPFSPQTRVERLLVVPIDVRWLSRRLRPSLVRLTAWSRYPTTRVVSINPCSRRCRRSPDRGSAGLPSWSRRSRLETTRNAPTVASVRDSEPRKVYSRSRSCTSSRSGPRGR
jgi:hypothetical protein